MQKNTPNISSDLPLPNDQSSQALLTESDALRQYLHAATADNTRKAYRSAIRQFEKWGGRLPTTADTVVRYLLDRAGALNTRTLDLHLTAISRWHYHQGFDDPARKPLVQKTMEGIRRIHGQPKRKAKALRLEHVAKMVNHLRQLPDTRKKNRDIALVLTGFFGAFRRSELVTIEVQDLHWEPEGLLIQLPRSKTDQQGGGLIRALPFGAVECCPATAIKEWIAVAEFTHGPVFRAVNRWGQVQPTALRPGAVNDLLKSLGQACQFDFVPDLSSHSFRRGLSTSAARERVDFELIKKQGGWKSDATVWGYIEEGQQLSDNAAVVLMEKMAKMLSTDR